jgi:hypothetical protein
MPPIGECGTDPIGGTEADYHDQLEGPMTGQGGRRVMSQMWKMSSGAVGICREKSPQHREDGEHRVSRKIFAPQQKREWALVIGWKSALCNSLSSTISMQASAFSDCIFQF